MGDQFVDLLTVEGQAFYREMQLRAELQEETLSRPAMSPSERLAKIERQLHPTDPTYCAEPIDIDDARFLLAQAKRAGG